MERLVSVVADIVPPEILWIFVAEATGMTDADVGELEVGGSFQRYHGLSVDEQAVAQAAVRGGRLVGIQPYCVGDEEVYGRAR